MTKERMRTAVRAFWWRTTLSATLIALVTTGVQAQRVTGRVTLPTGDAAPARVLIEINHERGGIAARGLTDASGRFDIPLDTAGRYAVRALRIGYLPSGTGMVVVGAGETATVNIVLRSPAVVLRSIQVVEEAACAADWKGAGATATLWEEARKALASAQVAASEDQLRVLAREVHALASPTGKILDSTLTAIWHEASTVRPFASVSERTLLMDGYVTAGEHGEVIYRAPDFDVLLSPAFVATHCLRVVPRAGDSLTFIGLAFEPTLQRSRTDIAGVMWLDRETAELREVDFRFTGSEALSDAPYQGGRVRFSVLPTGHWVVTDWQLRMPRPLERELTVRGFEVGEISFQREVIFTTDGPFDDILPTGTSVVAMACGAHLIAADTGMLRGEVVDRDGQPVKDALVTIEWRTGAGHFSLIASTTEDGHWFACGVPHGRRVTVNAAHPTKGSTEKRLERIGAGERFREISFQLLPEPPPQP